MAPHRRRVFATCNRREETDDCAAHTDGRPAGALGTHCYALSTMEWRRCCSRTHTHTHTHTVLATDWLTLMQRENADDETKQVGMNSTDRLVRIISVLRRSRALQMTTSDWLIDPTTRWLLATACYSTSSQRPLPLANKVENIDWRHVWVRPFKSVQPRAASGA